VPASARHSRGGRWDEQTSWLRPLLPFVRVIQVEPGLSESRNCTVKTWPGVLGQVNTMSHPCREMVVMTAWAEEQSSPRKAATVLICRTMCFIEFLSCDWVVMVDG
jgi:hypothetical protein